MAYKNLDVLSCPLPEDIRRVIDHGDLKLAGHLIDLRLKDEKVPLVMKERLLIEKRILKELPSVYPMNTEEALLRFNSVLDGFTLEELESYRDDGTCDWVYIDGEPHYHEDCVDTVLKTRPELTARIKDRGLIALNQGHQSALDEMMKDMKKSRGAVWRFRLKTTVSLKEEAQRIGERIRVYLPLPVSDAQCCAGKIRISSPDQAFIATENTPQRTACWNVTYEKDMVFATDAEWIIRAPYTALNPDDVSIEQPTFYTEEILPQIVFTPFIRQLAAELAGDIKNPLLKARRYYDYITTRCSYRFVPPYAFKTCIPEYFGTGQRGDCGMHALLFIALCRVSGIPARWQAGLYTPPWGPGMHDWARFYIAPYGWLYADASFGGSAFRAGNKERWDFYFGSIDPWRVVYNSALQQDFDPPKKYLRYDPYDNQSAEIEYEDRGLLRSEFKVKRELLTCEKVKN